MAALLLCGLYALDPSPAAAQTGAVTGRVVGAEEGAPLPGAQIFIEELDRGTLADSAGRYRLEGIPEGQWTVRARIIGYGRASRRLIVEAGQTMTANFRLSVTALNLDKVVVTATGEQRLRELGNAVSTVDADSTVAVAPVSNVSELLHGRAAGVQVQFSDGTVGAGSRIRIRGSSSLSLSNEPLIYVDGVRVNRNPASLSVFAGGVDPSRLDDISPRDIESVEIIKGPSAATLYGTEAANGVIRIQTKSGRALEEPTRWSLFSEGGVLRERGDWPANWRAVTDGGRPCPLLQAAVGRCTASEIRSFNLLENPATTPFEGGERFVGGVSVRGATEGLQFYTSGEFEKENGVFPSNELSRTRLRANFGGTLSEEISFQLNTGYVSSDLALPMNGDNIFGVILSGLGGGAEQGAWGNVTPEQMERVTTTQDVERFTGSTTLTWRPSGWLQVRGTGGLDATHRADEQLFPPGVIEGAERGGGEREADRHQTLAYTAELFARGDLRLTDQLTSRTTLGSQFFVDLARSVLTEGRILVPGTESLGTAARTSADEETTESRTLGFFLNQQFGWRDRLFLGAGVRVDDNSAFGSELDAVAYPRASLSWVISEEPWFPDGGAVESLRLRGAWGESGDQPTTNAAVPFFRGVSVTSLVGSTEIGVTREGGGIGNPDLKPARAEEFEAGLEASFVDDRLSVSATYYRKETENDLVLRRVAGSLGATQGRWENLGRTENEGVEGVVHGRVLDDGPVRLALEVSGSWNRNTLLELGPDVPPVQINIIQRHAEGFPLGGYWGVPIQSFEDANGDGIIGPREVTLGVRNQAGTLVPDSSVFLGEALPPGQASLRPALTLFDRIHLDAVFSARFGVSQANLNDLFQCLRFSGRFTQDPAAPLREQAACTAFLTQQSVAGFVQEADWAKLRELSVTVSAPQGLAERLNVNGMSLTLSGRNLATWTEYPGVDPEVNTRGNANFETLAFGSQPPLRHFTARLNLSF